MSITELAIKRPSLIVVIFGALTVLGIFGYNQLSYELLPKFAPPVVTISTIYPGASPSEVENSVSKPIEEAVSGLDNVSRINSTSQEGFSLVFVRLTQSANIDLALQEAQRKVNGILATMPRDVKTPVITKFALDEFPVLRMGATSSMGPREFYQFLKDRVVPRIAKQSGVAQVTLVGGNEREIKINLDAQKIKSYGLSLARVAQTIKASNLDFPTGNIKQEGTQFVVRVAGKFESVEALSLLVVGRSKQGGDIKLSDVAEVHDGQKDMSTLSRINGNESIGILVQKQSDANAVRVSELVRKELASMEKDYENVKLKITIAQDGSQFTVDAANAVKFDLMLAIVLVALTMFLFLHSIRNSIIVMIAIPASLVSTFFAMYLLGFTLNLMTLLALSLVVGILVDDSIVVLENIYHYLEKGLKPRDAAITGRNEIGFAALSITLVDVVVFVPLAMTTGLIGNIMRQFAIVVTVSTMMSLFVSFTVTPLLASRFSKLERMTNGTFLGRFALWFEALYEAFKNHYLRLLRWALSHRKTVVTATVLLFFSSCTLVPFGFIGNEFVTQGDRGEFAVFLELPSGATIESTNHATQQAEKIITAMPEVSKVFTNVGASSDGFLTMSSNNISELNVTLVDKSERTKTTDEVGALIKARIAEIPGVKVRVNPIGIFGTANQTPIQIVVSATNEADMKHAADRAMQILAAVPGATDVKLSAEDGKPETRIEVDRQKMAAFGLTIADIGQTLRIALTGDEDSKFRDGANEYTIRIRLDEFDRSNLNDVRHLSFINSRNEQIELQQFASIYQTAGPSKLQRQDRIGSITVMGQVLGRPSGNVVQDFQKAIALEKDKLGKDATFTYLGDEENRSEGFGSMGLAFLAGVLFVYLIMVALYDSYLYPFVVLFSIPVAGVGALLALALAIKSLSIFSLLGMIMMIGLVAKNAILLVDRTNDMKAQGMQTYDALMEAGSARLRPILMTTMAMVIGMLPIALASGAGAEWKTGLAWALIGGLTSSMFLTLIFVPIVYLKFDDWKNRVPQFFKRVTGKQSEPVILATGSNGHYGQAETVKSEA
ncbi:MAG TPA: efflux RND transporter permease subunit [bacterium]|nr:efflux RND transporter permease subunit [bacterium]